MRKYFSETKQFRNAKRRKAVFYLLPPTTGGQMMGCVIQTVDKKTIVIDGGRRGDGEQLMNFILKKADAHVDAWFFTHPHQDHLGAFCNIFNNMVGITVDKIYHHFPTIEELEEYEYRNADEKSIWTKTKEIFEEKFENKVQVVQTNDIFYIDEIKITVLRING